MDQTLEDLRTQLSQLEDALAPMLEGGQDAIKDVRERHGPEKAAETQLALGYAVNALFFVYLKTQGVDPQTHPVKEELARIREYMKKLKMSAAGKKAKEGMLRVNKGERLQPRCVALHPHCARLSCPTDPKSNSAQMRRAASSRRGLASPRLQRPHR